MLYPYRWRDWGAPSDTLPDGETNKRHELQESPQNAFFSFINGELLPNLKELKHHPDATARQKVISEIMTGVDRVRIDTEKTFSICSTRCIRCNRSNRKTHVFTLSQVYEGLLLKMGEKGNDGGQFFNPRQVIKAMVQVIDPRIDETSTIPVVEPVAFWLKASNIEERLRNDATAEQPRITQQRSFWGREKENLIYPIALANLILHGIDKPNLWHGNTLTGQETYGGLFENAPQTFDVILTNPPFGGKEGKDAQTSFDYKTGATQVLFLQHIIRNLRNGGRCGIVLDEGLLFRANEEPSSKPNANSSMIATSGASSVFLVEYLRAGAGVKTTSFSSPKASPQERTGTTTSAASKSGKKHP